MIRKLEKIAKIIVSEQLNQGKYLRIVKDSFNILKDIDVSQAKDLKNDLQGFEREQDDLVNPLYGLLVVLSEYGLYLSHGRVKYEEDEEVDIMMKHYKSDRADKDYTKFL